MNTHFPVMSAEVLSYLAVRQDSKVADLTAGSGGHSKLIASQLTTGILVMNDRDGESLALAKENTKSVEDRILPTKGTFSTFPERLQALNIGRLDAILMDLGVSMKQLTDPERGFSFRLDGPLDMRMSRDSDDDLTAADLVNTLPEKELADLIYQHGEEWRSRAIARAVVRARPITTTLQLARAAGHGAGARNTKISPATKTFMALRLYLNNEMEELTSIMDALPGLMAPGGRVVALTFMSTEDRIVKQRFQGYQRDGVAKILTKHVVKPSDEELRINPASRSAKLRALEWTAGLV
jgi:16S rRNA (cytosine1402-N4)-methyltransferase